MFSRRARAALRGRLFNVFEQTWAALFATAGIMLRSRYPAERWTTSGGRRVVIVAAHPDDETIGAGGVAMLHLRAGDDVTIVVVTDGGGSGALGLTRSEMVRRRALEIRAAVAALGVRQLICLDLPEWEWQAADARERLAAVLSGADIIYTHSCVDYHPEHVAVAAVTAALLRPGQLVRVYELGVPLTPVLANCIADIGDVAAAKARVMAVFETQRGSLEAVQRLATYRARFYGLNAVEVFWELDADDYRRIIARCDWRSGSSPYRGVRMRPFTDPLSTVVGLGERTKLRSMTMSAADRSS